MTDIDTSQGPRRVLAEVLRFEAQRRQIRAILQQRFPHVYVDLTSINSILRWTFNLAELLRFQDEVTKRPFKVLIIQSSPSLPEISWTCVE